MQRLEDLIMHVLKVILQDEEIFILGNPIHIVKYLVVPNT
jgi:hypothetical protein